MKILYKTVRYSVFGYLIAFSLMMPSVSTGLFCWWAMMLIGLAIIALLALSVFNFINLTKPKFCPDDLKAALLDHMMNCRVRSAIELSASHPSYLGRMLAYSLPNIDATKYRQQNTTGTVHSQADLVCAKSNVW